MEAIRSSETSVHIRITRRYIPEDDSFHNYHCENFNSYNMHLVWEQLHCLRCCGIATVRHASPLRRFLHWLGLTCTQSLQQQLTCEHVSPCSHFLSHWTVTQSSMSHTICWCFTSKWVAVVILGCFKRFCCAVKPHQERTILYSERPHCLLLALRSVYCAHTFR
jgi:hypothetical protein